MLFLGFIVHGCDKPAEEEEDDPLDHMVIHESDTGRHIADQKD